ncbi:transposase [Trichonephila clavata]|uniref:Transposase n=1 Tax=Trichonephila clavata TaxID=2740835 RepID=A0A8X6IRT7_TRICU|nr:transposase [Trichonephila clavata]
MGKFLLFYSCKRQSYNLTVKTCNLKTYYEQKQGEIDEVIVGERKGYLQSLKNNLTSKQYIFQKKTAQSDGIVSVSFRVPNIISNNMKPFTDGNYTKDCLIVTVEELYRKKLNIFTQISLSRQTVERGIERISSEICASLNTITTSFVYFSLALDETLDLNDITEELLEFVSLKGQSPEEILRILS